MSNNGSIIPNHIAIIMDGNRRWARARGLNILDGHQKVADDVLEPLIEHGAKLGVAYMTFWAWSTENWAREIYEVNGIMQLFRHVIQKRWKRLHEKGVRIRVIGNIEKFPNDIRDALEKVIDQTKNNKTITAIFALNYGGRDEILRAISRLHGERKVTEEQFTQHLDTAGIPDPELIVRPGGEKRLSGFLLWQSEYSELIFVDWYMPDFTPTRLDEVIAEYQMRQRRFGR